MFHSDYDFAFGMSCFKVPDRVGHGAQWVTPRRDGAF